MMAPRYAHECSKFADWIDFHVCRLLQSMSTAQHTSLRPTSECLSVFMFVTVAAAMSMTQHTSLTTDASECIRRRRNVHEHGKTHLSYYRCLGMCPRFCLRLYVRGCSCGCGNEQAQYTSSRLIVSLCLGCCLWLWLWILLWRCLIL